MSILYVGIDLAKNVFECRRFRGHLFRSQSLRQRKDSNWVQTDSKGRFEVLARFYGPQKALFDKTW